MTNMFVRNMDLEVPVVGDNRRLEVVVDGLPLHGGVQLAPHSCPLFVGAATTDDPSQERKEKTYQELTGPGGCCSAGWNRRGEVVFHPLVCSGSFVCHVSLWLTDVSSHLA